jgi:hypothetical protein
LESNNAALLAGKTRPPGVSRLLGEVSFGILRTRFTHPDGTPIGIAGLWDRYRDPAGQWQESYTMLTIKADKDPLFREYHQPGKEKRMVVTLPEGA